MINFNSSPKFVLSYDKLMSNSSPNSDDTDRFLLLVEEGRTTDIRLGALYCAVVFSVFITAPLPWIDIYMYTRIYKLRLPMKQLSSVLMVKNSFSKCKPVITNVSVLNVK